MQHFNAPLTPEDRQIVRRIYHGLFIIYSSIALVLAAYVAAHIILKDPTVASAPVETTTKTAAIGERF